MLGTPNAGNASPDVLPLDLGFKRIWSVRVFTGGAGGSRYEVEGVVHRQPVTQPITPRMAAHLVADGVPLVIHENGSASC